MWVLLATERLILRRFTEADEENLFDLDSDPEVMRFLTGGTPTPRDKIHDEILPRFMTYDERSEILGFWAAVEKASGDFLGWFSFRPRPGGSADEVGLGYRLRRSAWGKGYATEGSRALIRKGFGEFGITRVVATAYEHNVSSRRVMEKSGLKLTRRFRLTPADLIAAGTFDVTSQETWDGDDVEYALERHQWDLTDL